MRGQIVTLLKELYTDYIHAGLDCMENGLAA